MSGLWEKFRKYRDRCEFCIQMYSRHSATLLKIYEIVLFRIKRNDYSPRMLVDEGMAAVVADSDTTLEGGVWKGLEACRMLRRRELIIVIIIH